MRAIDLIRKKRDGGSLTADEIGWMVEQYTAARIPDYQMSAWLMAALLRGLDRQELAALTDVMLHSGSTLDLSDIRGAKVDKHSTGGVGDKTSLIIAPAAAAAGLIVPMISGRGLGHTGGTLDKLESIPGFSTELGLRQMHAQLANIGVAMIGQTGDIAPADKRLYALRDVTGTVESPELICASIMSKKLAEGIDGLVLDVKTGSGAFMKSEEEARHLARLMVETGSAMGKNVAALITDMDQPLGLAIGNALEVQECVEVLEGRGPADLVELSSMLTAWMLVLGGMAPRISTGEAIFRQVIKDGSARRKFSELVEAQGGDLERLPFAANVRTVTANASGFLSRIDCERVGVASLVVGAGRERKEDSVDPAVGILMKKKLGDEVMRGDPLCEIHFNDPARVDEAFAILTAAIVVAELPPAQRTLVREVITTHG